MCRSSAAWRIRRMRLRPSSLARPDVDIPCGGISSARHVGDRAGADDRLGFTACAASCRGQCLGGWCLHRPRSADIIALGAMAPRLAQRAKLMEWLCLVLEVVTLAVWIRVAALVVSRAEQGASSMQLGRAAYHNQFRS